MGMFLVHVGSVGSTTATSEEENRLFQNKLFCDGVNNQSYTCDSGHCCGHSQCCSYYYELWWFWLVWALIFVLSCCCVCHHRRTKHRLQQQQRQHEINLIAYREAHNYTSVPFYFRFLPNYLLPEYEEVVNRPSTPPPPYCALTSNQSAGSSLLNSEQPDGVQPPPQPTPVPHDCENLSLGHGVDDCDFPPQYIQKEDHKAQLEIGHSGPEQSGIPIREPLDSKKQEGDHPKELLKHLTSKVWPEEEEEHDGNGAGEERSAGRHRRFTGDSGIEVCVCGPVQECETLQEFSEMLGDSQEMPPSFCDGCATCHRNDEGWGLRSADMRVEVRPAAPICLLLHTVNEQDESDPPATAELQR